MGFHNERAATNYVVAAKRIQQALTLGTNVVPFARSQLWRERYPRQPTLPLGNGVKEEVSVKRPALCPVCAYRMRKGDIHPGTIICPGCRQPLHIEHRHALFIGLTTFLLTSAVLFFAGLRGLVLVVSALLLHFPIYMAIAAIKAWLRGVTLARGGASYSKANLRITPKD